MAFKPYKQYIDTDVSGLIIVIEHNLDGIPFLELQSYDNITGRHTYVSLLDARISEVKTLDSNNIQITFNATFKGYIDLFISLIEDPSISQRITDLDNQVMKNYNLILDRVTFDKWTQLDVLRAAQIQALENKTVDLQNQVNTLTNIVDRL